MYLNWRICKVQRFFKTCSSILGIYDAEWTIHWFTYIHYCFKTAIFSQRKSSAPQNWPSSTALQNHTYIPLMTSVGSQLCDLGQKYRWGETRYFRSHWIKLLEKRKSQLKKYSAKFVIETSLMDDTAFLWRSVKFVWTFDYISRSESFSFAEKIRGVKIGNRTWHQLTSGAKCSSVSGRFPNRFASLEWRM